MSVRAKKHLGQHFLTNQAVAKDIVQALTWENYCQALEIGPGMGVLTQYLVQEKKKISVVEIDSESVEYLKKLYTELELKIYSEDFLKMNLKEKFDAEFAIIGNFPYNISSQILFKVLENLELIPEVVGMFQKEVAERVAANHGNKTYGILSVLIQYYFEVEYLFTVHENDFNPPPKVKSGVIRLKRKSEIEEIEKAKFFKVVKTAFNQRRKKLSNALKPLNAEYNQTAEKFLNLRAEQLSVENFVELTQNLKL